MVLPAAVAVCLTIAGCSQPSPQKAEVIAQPKTPVVKNITSFSESLRCMDDMFLAYGKQNIVITSDGLPDQTNKIQAGTKEMLISTIAKMSAKSKAFRFVDMDQRGDSVFYIEDKLIGRQSAFQIPRYYIRGAITQADLGVMNDKESAGAAAPFLSLGVSRDQLVTLVSMDMNLGDTVSRQILPGYSSTNTIAIVRQEKSADAQGLIAKGSLTFNITSDRSEGSHQAVRTLVELGAIEVLGKLARVPYWRCLGIESTNPEMMAQARDWYDDLSPEDRVSQVQEALRHLGTYSGPVDGKVTAPLRVAIDKYKVENDLIANGTIDFDLYYKLLLKGLIAGKQAEGAVTPAKAGQPAAEDAEGGDFDLGLTVRPQAAAYHSGDKLTLAVTVAKPSDVYCYYQSAEGVVARVFPNRFSPKASLTPGQTVVVPSGNKFSLVLDKPGSTEFVACVATAEPYGANRPAVLDEPDLAALSEKTIQEAVQQHLDIDKFASAVQFVTVEVK